MSLQEKIPVTEDEYRFKWEIENIKIRRELKEELVSETYRIGPRINIKCEWFLKVKFDAANSFEVEAHLIEKKVQIYMRITFPNWGEETKLLCKSTREKGVLTGRLEWAGIFDSRKTDEVTLICKVRFPSQFLVTFPYISNMEQINELCEHVKKVYEDNIAAGCRSIFYENLSNVAKFILGARSNALSALNHNKSKEELRHELNLDDRTDQFLLKYLFTGEFNITRVNQAEELKEVADKLELQSLKNNCDKFIKARTSGKTKLVGIHRKR